MKEIGISVKDLSGKTFGKLFVIEYAGVSSSRNSIWRCRCSCDNKIVLVTGASLNAGRTKSCGCLKFEIGKIKSENRRLSIIGSLFHKLIVDSIYQITPKDTYFKCKCECGNTTIVRGSALVSGTTKSCGCYNNYRSSVYNSDRFNKLRESMVGKKFGRLTIVENQGSSKGHSKFKCLCDCGKEKIVLGSSLRNGSTRSCGCLAIDVVSDLNSVHGLSDHPLYNTWNGMIQRCYNKNNTGYHNYGGRGITVCDEWRYNPKNFIAWAESSGYQPGLTIDRYPDNDGPYAPWNCRWATRTEQNRNTRSKVIKDIDMAENIRNDSRSAQEISKFYNISLQLVNDIKKNKIWKSN